MIENVIFKMTAIFFLISLFFFQASMGQKDRDWAVDPQVFPEPRQSNQELDKRHISQI